MSQPGFRRVFFFLGAAALGVFGLAGCSASSTALWNVVSDSWSSEDKLAQAPRDPRFQYLRVDTAGAQALMVLGYMDGAPSGQGADQVWYSASKEVLRLREGRLSGASGLAVEWRDVRFSALPSWRSVLERPSGASYQRWRDVMPGQLTGVKDTVSVRAIAVPQRLASSFRPPPGLQWFEETVVSAPASAGLPPARYAVDLSGPQETVVYSEQCLSNDLCVVLRPLPPVPQAPPAR